MNREIKVKISGLVKYEKYINLATTLSIISFIDDIPIQNMLKGVPPIQARIIALYKKDKGIWNLSLRKLGRLVGTNAPQLIKYHKEQILKKHLLDI